MKRLEKNNNNNPKGKNETNWEETHISSSRLCLEIVFRLPTVRGGFCSLIPESSKDTGNTILEEPAASLQPHPVPFFAACPDSDRAVSYPPQPRPPFKNSQPLLAWQQRTNFVSRGQLHTSLFSEQGFLMHFFFF